MLNRLPSKMKQLTRSARPVIVDAQDAQSGMFNRLAPIHE
jgi:hypothetical protein